MPAMTVPPTPKIYAIAFTYAMDWCSGRTSKWRNRSLATLEEGYCVAFRAPNTLESLLARTIVRSNPRGAAMHG